MESKEDVENIMKQRFFVAPTEYPPQNGFLDYGPAVTEIKRQVLTEFRRVFVDENTYEIEPSAVLPYDVLKASGHIDRFCDLILTDGNSIFRADHYIEDTVGKEVRVPRNVREAQPVVKERVEALKMKKIVSKHKRDKVETLLDDLNVNSTDFKELFTKEEVDEILLGVECDKKTLDEVTKEEIDFIVLLHNVHSPTGGTFAPAAEHNLIFKLNASQFLRPELAQSQFVNFRRLYDMNYERLPFSSLAVGRSYRNEISARGGMYRTKEFEQAEIEYFSENGEHSGFKEIQNTVLMLLPVGSREPVEMSIKDAFSNEVISSQAICYFLSKAQEFLLGIGFTKEVLRFRQHYPNEMAHYACDCWDAEIKTKNGWIECAGIADRGTFDLSCHSKSVNTNARKVVPLYEMYEVKINRKELGAKLRERAKVLEEYIMSLSQSWIRSNKEGSEITVDFEGEGFTFQLVEKKVDYELFTPRVVEPSFGISRIMYALIEHNFTIRDGRNVLSLKPSLCYLHCVISFLKYLDEFEPLLNVLKKGFVKNQIRFKTNWRTCSLGRKYSSADEVGVPYFVVLDFETPRDNCVTIRERDSMSQIRVPVGDASGIISELLCSPGNWEDYFSKHGLK